MPADIAFLDPPEKYYTELMQQMEEKYTDNQDKVNNCLKGSYIEELENAITVNLEVFQQKSSFYYNALLFGLLAVIPYIICIGFHLSKKEIKIEQVELIDRKNS